MTPTEKHRETAKDIAFDFDCDWTADGRRRGEAEYRAAIEAIAAALAKAEREGMKRAAELIRCDCCDVCGESPGYPKCANELADLILSEAGEG